MGKKLNFKEDFTLVALLLIPVSVAINMVGFQICQLLRLPIFLDSIGTILVAIIAGPIISIITGFVTNLINAIFNPTYFPYVITSMAIGAFAGVLSKYGMFKSKLKVFISGFILTLVSTIVSAPVTVFFFGGLTGSTGSIITAGLLASGQQMWTAVFSSGFIIEAVDKLISVYIVAFIVGKISERYLSKLKYGYLYIGRKVARNLDFLDE